MLHYLKNVSPEEIARAYGHVAPAAPLSRRGFLKLAGGAGVGLLVGAALPFGAGNGRATAAPGMQIINPFVEITPDNKISVISKHLDKGQGSATGLATLVADELDAALEQVSVAFAPANAALYKNLAFGIQGTGGSSAIANSFMQYRNAGAAARLALVKAAAKKWGVPEGEVKTSGGVLSHASGKSAPYGALAEMAASVKLPKEIPLKKPEQWNYIGKHFRRVDSAIKSTGAIKTYGMDVKLDNMIYAVVARPPKFGAAFKSMDDTKARKVKGVIDIRPGPTGVVIFAENTFAAIKGRERLQVQWDDSKAETRGSDQLFAHYHDLSGKPGPVAHTSGDAKAGLGSAVKTIEATYEIPFLAHAPMEPLDVVIHAEKGKVTLWTGSQMQTIDQMVVGSILKKKPEQVFINTMWAGGSFGRRAVHNSEYAAEAALVSTVWGKSQPIKVVWTREDDIHGGYFRPMYVHKVTAGVDAKGNIAGWHHRIVGQSIFTGTSFEKFVVHNGIDHSSVEGIADTTYKINNFHVELHTVKVGVPVLWWRSVGHSHTAYVMETMMDRLAEAAGRDPLEFRLAHLGGDPRLAGVLKLAAEKAGWGKDLPKGKGRGIAVHKSFNSYVAEVADISTDAKGKVKVERVVAAVDCGVPVNPDNIRAQVEGGIGYGLSAILQNEVTLTNGVVDQGNFDTYEPLRINQMPHVEVHIVPSAEAPTGIGEPGTPPIGPAVANALRAATGKVVNRLPFTKSGLV